MNRLSDTNVWNDGRSYEPDRLAIVEHYEKLARQARRGRFGFANRATRAPNPVSRFRPSGRVSAIACVALSLLTLAYFGWQLAGRPGL